MLTKETFYDDLENSWRHSCDMLRGAVKNRHSPFRTGNIAYIDSNMPIVRTVVLRHVSDDLKIIGCHTDYRSPKVQAFKNNPNATFHFYAPSEKLQLVAQGRVVLHYKDDTTLAAWEKTQLLSRRCYLSKITPGEYSPIPTSALPDAFIDNSHTYEDSETGYDNFCVIRFHVESWDRLYLSHSGNRRMRAVWSDSKNIFETHWVVP